MTRRHHDESEVDLDAMFEDMDNPIDKKTLLALERDAKLYARRGAQLFGVAIAVAAALLWVTYHLTGSFVDELNAATDPNLMLLLLLVRGTFFGSLAIAFLAGAFSIANAYIDQSTRFRKRLYSAHMLNYAFRTFRDDIKKSGTVSVADLVRMFVAWNETVDSAFSRIRFQRKAKDMVLGGDAARLALQEPTGGRRAGDDGPKK
jgi:hypothetical protein